MLHRHVHTGKVIYALFKPKVYYNYLLRNRFTLSTKIMGDKADKHSESRTISFKKGYPDRGCIGRCAEILHEASKDILDSQEGRLAAVHYGPKQGSQQFRDELATFLSQQYGDSVKSDELFLTSGASVGVNFLTTMFFTKSHPIFVEDPTYYIASELLSADLNHKLHPVTLESDGINIEELDEKLADNCAGIKTSSRYPWRGMVYVIPGNHNPSGITYSAEKGKKLLSLAVKHNVLVVCDDVYHLLSYDDAPPPLRLYSYDTRGDSGPGHVTSVCSFTKYFSPGVRLGWIEARPDLVQRLVTTGLLNSGGGLNHYMSVLMTHVIRRGLLSQHIDQLRHVYKEKRDVFAAELEKHLPPGCHFLTPKISVNRHHAAHFVCHCALQRELNTERQCEGGGYFLWLVLPQNVRASDVSSYMNPNEVVEVKDGLTCSINGNFSNCMRLCFTERTVEDISIGVRHLCLALHRLMKSRDATLA